VAATLHLEGSLVIDPTQRPPSGGPSVSEKIDERISVRTGVVDEYELTEDGWTPVSLGSLASAGFIMLKAVGGSFQVRVTSGAATDQVIPCSSLFVLINEHDPITALDVRRESGVNVSVKVVLG
jgi:hypothetical protein